MAFGISKTATRRREFNEPPGEWIGWIEPGIEMEGKMKVGAGLFRLNAHFKGDISSEGAVVIHDQGEIEGRVQAKVVSVTGKVKGEVHAAERLEIKEHGILLGNIFTPCLLIDPGGFFDGECHMPTPEPATAAEAAPVEPETKDQP
jgi:cytoskeletal protein CcmA (bactofilin family)